MTLENAQYFQDVLGCPVIQIGQAETPEDQQYDVRIGGTQARTPQQAFALLKDLGGDVLMAERHFLGKYPSYRHELMTMTPEMMR
jgi:hypothetical protein